VKDSFYYDCHYCKNKSHFFTQEIVMRKHPTYRNHRQEGVKCNHCNKFVWIIEMGNWIKIFEAIKINPPVIIIIKLDSFMSYVKY